MKYCSILFLLIIKPFAFFAQDSTLKTIDKISFSGTISAGGFYMPKNQAPVEIFARYIPSLNYGITFPEKQLFSFEVSANGLASLAASSSKYFPESSIALYRAWMRYSTSQLEIRAGLQKINFGSASLIRPLMWFDQIDVRDPLKLTNGVWGLLGRYYFLNNANAWLWCLYGNDKPRLWDIGKSNKNIPEIGGRYQFPIPKGELALTDHYRNSNMIDTIFQNSNFAKVPENKMGIDGKFDLRIGLWFEATWTNKSKDAGMLTNMEMLNIGLDNTFAWGNGLHIIFEQLFIATHKKAFVLNNNINFSCVSLTYPLGMVDNLNAIVYYDWRNHDTYNFINWMHNFKKFSFYFIVYLNPEKYNLPQAGANGILYNGPGAQVMIVYNH